MKKLLLALFAFEAISAMVSAHAGEIAPTIANCFMAWVLLDAAKMKKEEN